MKIQLIDKGSSLPNCWKESISDSIKNFVKEKKKESK
jgi:hypothetical protein